MGELRPLIIGLNMASIKPNNNLLNNEPIASGLAMSSDGCNQPPSEWFLQVRQNHSLARRACIVIQSTQPNGGNASWAMVRDGLELVEKASTLAEHTSGEHTFSMEQRLSFSA